VERRKVGERKEKRKGKGGNYADKENSSTASGTLKTGGKGGVLRRKPEKKKKS